MAERWQEGDRQRHHRRLRPVRDLAGGDRQHGSTSTEFTGTIGLPLPSTDIAIRDDDGKDLPLGEVGEICIRGPQVMAGYWNRPDETAKVMTPDGFFKSGDMGFMDEKGYTKIVDRKKDMILVSGFNVYPNELEEVVAQHPGVLEVAAIGVPDEHSGEVPKLFVVKKDPDLTDEALRDLLQGEPHRLQAAEIHRVPHRTAEDAGGQDLAAGAEGVALSRPRLSRVNENTPARVVAPVSPKSATA